MEDLLRIHFSCDISHNTQVAWQKVSEIWVKQKIQTAGYLIKVSEKHLKFAKNLG
jgi:hypothetical protein